MPEALTFRRPRARIALAAAAAVALCACLCGYLVLFSGMRQGSQATGDVAAVVLALLAAVAGPLGAARQRIVVGHETLTYRGALRTRTIRWSEVIEAEAPWGLYGHVPILLRLRPRLGAGWLARLWPPRLFIRGTWSRHGFLVREIVARVPHAALGRRLRGHLAAPNRVSAAYRLSLLVSLALAVGAAAYALLDAFPSGVIGLFPGLLAVAAALPCSLLAGPAGREWRAKPPLIAGYAVLVVALALGFMPAMLFGLSQQLLLLLAACLGWAVATLAVCVPMRRPRPGHAAAAYAIALLAAVAPTWWLAVREEFPVRMTASLDVASASPAWSPDGRRLALPVGDAASGGGDYLVFDVPSLQQVQALPIHDVAARFYLLDGHRALHQTILVFRNPDRSLCTVSKLWACDVRSGRQQLLATPPRLRLAPEGFVSPDRRRAVFLGRLENEPRWDLYLLQLDGLSVSRFPSALDFSRFDKARWAADGSLVFTERAMDVEARLTDLSLWSLAPGGGQLTRLLHATAPDADASFSPDVHWAVVTRRARNGAPPRYDLVDLTTRQSRPIDLPGRPYPHHFRWSPDGQAFAYAVHQYGTSTLLVVRPASGAVARPYATDDGLIDSVALSVRARFAACTTQGTRAAHVRIIEVATGRLFTLRRPMPFPPRIEPTWSPAGFRLAVPCRYGLLHGENAIRIALVDLGPGD